MSITTVMLFLINTIYNQAVQATRRGVQTSDVIAAHRGFADQVQRDFDNMVPPGEAATPGVGFMAILHRQVPNVRMPTLDGAAGITGESLRTDQVLFIRYASDAAITDLGSFGQDGDELLESAGPGNSGTFSPGSNIRADYARVWYGHLDYTDDDGQLFTDTLVDASGGGSSGLMNNGWNWMLGRQALLLAGPRLRSNSNATAWVDRGGGPYWTGIAHDSGDGGITTSLPGADERMYAGYGDWSDLGLHSEQTWAIGQGNEALGTDAHPFGARPVAIIGVSSATDSGGNTYPLYTGQPHTGAGSYVASVYDISFGPERLKANPNPPSTLESWQVGQTHPIAMVNVSDFIVDFAADTNNDGEIDTDSTGDGLPDGGGGPNVPVIVWYGFNNLPAWATASFPDESGSGGVAFPDPGDPNNNAAALAITPNADAAFVWRHDYRYNWPHLLRFRYRMHDTRGDLKSNAWGANDGKDNDGDGDIDAADTTGPDENRDFPINGKWFEVIVPVKRMP